MIATKPSDDIQDFLQFLSDTMGSQTSADRAGAPQADIDAFAELVKQPLPALYVGYLKEFGQRDRTLMMTDDTDARLSTLISFYEEQAGAEESDIPTDAVMIGVNGLSGERALKYSNLLNSSPINSEPTVVVSEFGKLQYVYADSFRNHLYRQAFVRGRFRVGALFSLRRNEELLLPVARQAFEDVGFKSYWFSDAYQVCLERYDSSAAVYIARIPGRTSIFGCFEDRTTRDELKAKFMQNLALEDSTPT